MWRWIRRYLSSPPVPRPIEPPDRHVRAAPRRIGQYAGFHNYLADRYADVVVLTLAQIEDLLGFALPASAWTRSEWWTTEAQAGNPSCADAWVLAGRTARPDLPARVVVFERLASR